MKQEVQLNQLRKQEDCHLPIIHKKRCQWTVARVTPNDDDYLETEDGDLLVWKEVE